MNMRIIVGLAVIALVLSVGMAGAGYLTTSQRLSLTNSTPDMLRLGNTSADQTVTLNKADYNNLPRTYIVAANPGAHYVILKAASGDTIGGQAAIQSTDQGSSAKLVPDPAANTYRIVDQIGIWNITQTLGDVAVSSMDVSEEIDQIGDLSELDTTEQGTVVGAMNEVVAAMGDLSTLDTTEQSSLVGALNETTGRVETQETYVGDVPNMTTTASDLAGAVNELDSDTAQMASDLVNLTNEYDQTALDVGDVANITTTATDLAGAVNELDAGLGAAVLDIGNNSADISIQEGYAGDVPNLTTTATDLAGAANELDSDTAQISSDLSNLTIDYGQTVLDVGDAPNMTTTAKNLAGAVNELDSDISGIGGDISDLQGYILHLNVIVGGSAGNHTLTGVAVGDELGGVIYATKTAGNLTTLTDLGSEFAGGGKGIIDTDVIANGGGTDSSGGYLIVAWIDKT